MWTEVCGANRKAEILGRPPVRVGSDAGIDRSSFRGVMVNGVGCGDRAWTPASR
jgi:hypothetical protein